MSLRLEEVDLESLIMARNDAHPDGDWWFDPRSGESLYYGLDDDSDLPALVEGVHVLIPREPYGRETVVAFLDAALEGTLDVSEDEAARLHHLFHRKGGMRRFQDQIGRSPAAGAWRDHLVANEAERAVAWLRERGLLTA